MPQWVLAHSIAYSRRGRRGGREGVFHCRGCSQVVERVAESVTLPLEPRSRVLELQQRLLLARSALESAPHEERERSREKVAPEIHPSLLLRLPIQPVRDPNHIPHVRLHFARNRINVLILLRWWPILEPGYPRHDVRPGTHDPGNTEPLLAFADEEEAVVDKALMLDNLADAADVSDGAGLGEDDAESEIGLEERVHHDSVPELEDLEGKDGAGEEDEWEREKRELDKVVAGGATGVGGGASVGDREAVASILRGGEEGGSGGRGRGEGFEEGEGKGSGCGGGGGGNLAEERRRGEDLGDESHGLCKLGFNGGALKRWSREGISRWCWIGSFSSL